MASGAADGPSDLAYRQAKHKQTSGNDLDPMRIGIEAVVDQSDLANQQEKRSQTRGDAVRPTGSASAAAPGPYRRHPVRDHPETQNTIENQKQSIQNLENLCQQITERLALIEANQKTLENTVDQQQDRTASEDRTDLNDSSQDLKPLRQRSDPSSPALPSNALVTRSTAILKDADPINPRTEAETKKVDSPPISKLVEAVGSQHSEPNPSIAPVSHLQVPEARPQLSLEDNKAFEDRLAAIEARLKKLEDEREALRKEFDQKLESKTNGLQAQLDALAERLKKPNPSEPPGQFSPVVPQTITKRRMPFIEFAPPIDLFTKEDMFG